MTADNIAALVTSIGSLLGVIILFVKIFKPPKKEEAETKNTEADAAETWEGIAARSGERIRKLEERIDSLVLKVDELQRQLNEKDKKLKKWQEGIGILVEQIKQKGDTPNWYPNGE